MSDESGFQGRQIVAPDEFTSESVADLLVKIFSAPEPPLPPPTADTIFRCSYMPRFCARREAIAGQEGISQEKLVIDDESSRDPDMDLADIRFAGMVGTALHSVLQNNVLHDLLLGRWECVTCGAVHQNDEGVKFGVFIPKPDACGRQSGPRGAEMPCEGRRFVFAETRFRDAEFGIEGQPDGALLLTRRDGSKAILEIKGLTHWSLTTQRRDGRLKWEYEIQGNLYLHLSGLDWLAGLLVARNMEKFKLSSKDRALEVMVVRRNESLLKKVRGQIATFRNAMIHGTLPTRDCLTDSCDKARRCPLVKRCFELPDD